MEENTKQQLFEKELELKKISERLIIQYRQGGLFVLPKIDITSTSGKEVLLSYLKNINDENLQHPFYWAAFVLSGDKSPIQLTENSFFGKKSKAVIIFLLLAIVTVIGFFVAKGKKQTAL